MYTKQTDYEDARTTKSKTALNRCLITGAELGDLSLVKLCLQRGADINVNTNFGRSSLHIASERGDINLGRMLLKFSNLELNTGTYHSYTPLQLACNSRRHDFVDLLLEHGAKPDAVDKLGRTTLHYAAMNSDLRVAEACLKYGSNVNAVDALSKTPLSLAVVDTIGGCVAMVELLLRHGADVHLARDMCVPLFLDCVMNFNDHVDTTATFQILELLLKAGVDPNETDPPTGKNALHYAAVLGNMNLALFLINHGTKLFGVRDGAGRTPTDIAQQFNHINMTLYFQHLDRVRDRISEVSFKSDDMYF